VASRIVRRQDVDDVVHTGALRFIESLEGPEARPFPATDGVLRALFMDIVRRYAFDCVRDGKRPQLQTHSNWGMEWQPVVRGHNVPDRPLDSVFARNNERKYDAPAAASRREQDDVGELRHILDRHLDRLAQRQREILVESFLEQEKRADIAARLGITLSTYDSHRHAALEALRKSLAAEVKASRGADRSIWYDRIEELISLRAARLRDRSSSKKGKGSSAEGKGASSRGEGVSAEGIRDSSRGDPANSEGERVNVEGARHHAPDARHDAEAEHRGVKAESRAVTPERANAAHERDNNQHEGDAVEPTADRSSGARYDAERPRPRIVRRSLQGTRRTPLHSAGKPRSTR